MNILLLDAHPDRERFASVSPGDLQRFPHHRGDRERDRPAPEPVGQEQGIGDAAGVGQDHLPAKLAARTEEIAEVLIYAHGALHAEELDRDALPFRIAAQRDVCLLYTSPSPRDQRGSRMPSSA